MEMKRILALGVILLFVGVAVAPSINFNVVKASNDNDLVEVTTQACGIKGFGNTTVKLTRQQYQHLEQYLVDFRARLNKTTTREEAVPIFKEAVVELNKYGLLPKGMSVEQVQKLAIGQNQINNLAKLQGKLLNNRLASLNINSNYFSLIAGVTSITFIMELLTLICLVPSPIGFLLMYSFARENHLILWGIAAFILFPSLLLGLMSYLLPGTLFSVIALGMILLPIVPDVPPEYFPSYGWVYSFGIAGVKSWIGPFYGNIFTIPFFFSEFFIGIIGFTGIKIVLPGHCFYFGSALSVNIGPDRP